MTHSRRISRLNGGCGVCMEGLENRVLLSTTWTGTGSDGSPLKVTLSGEGTLAVTGGSNSTLDTITVNSTSPRDVLTITGKPLTAGAHIPVKKIAVTGPLKAIVAPKVDLQGDAGSEGIVANDWIGKLSLYSVGASVTVAIGPTGVALDKPISIAMGGVFFNASMTVSSPIASFKASTITGSVLSESYIKSMKISADMAASVTSGGYIGSIKVAHFASGNWQADGDIGKVKVETAATGLHLVTPGNIGSVTTTGDANFFEIVATTLGSLKVHGNMQVQSWISLSGTSPDEICLRKMTVDGWIRNVVLRAHGSVGSISAGGVGQARLFAGVLNGFNNYGGTDAADTVLENVGGSLSTASIRKIVVTGKAQDPDNPGNVHAVEKLHVAAASLPYVRLAKVDFNVAATHAIMAQTFGTIVGTDVDKNTYRYGVNWPAGTMLIVPLV